MYCKSCEKELNEQTTICPACGVRQASENQYCPDCGNNILPRSEFCAVCGRRLSSSVSPKSKTTAVLLAIFLGFWAWLYLYKRNSGKFWLNLILTIVSGFSWGLVAWIWAIIYAASKPESWYQNY